MPENSIQIIIEGKNNATKAFGRLQEDLQSVAKGEVAVSARATEVSQTTRKAARDLQQQSRAVALAFKNIESLEDRSLTALTSRRLRNIATENRVFIAQYQDRITALNQLSKNVSPIEFRTAGFEEIRDNLQDAVDRAKELGPTLAASLQQARGIERSVREELAGIADLRIDDQLSGLAEATQRNQEAAFAGAREAGQQLTRNLLEGGEAVQREFARKRIQATRQVVRQIERIETGLARAQSVNSLERLQTDTRQLRTELQQRGRAWQAHTDRVTALSRDISDSLDEALRTERLENFQDAVANVVSDLAQTGFDFIFDSIFDRASSAADKIKTFTDDVRGDIRLLKSDIRRLTRFDEDRELGEARLREDQERARRQLQFRLREAAGQQIFGDQRALQRNIERQQSIRLQLRDRLEDFDVRIQRFGQDTELRRNRLVDDATRNRERAEAPRDQKGFLERLGRRITDSISAALSDKIGNFIASALTSALPGLLGGLFGGGEDGEPTAKVTITDPIPLQVPPEGLKLAVPADGIPVNLKAALSSITAAPDVDLPSVTGLEGSVSKVVLRENADLPGVPNLKGGISRVVLQLDATLPIVPGLTASIDTVELSEGVTLPTLPGIVIPVTFDIPDLPEGFVDVGPLEVVPDTPAPTPTEATAPTADVRGMITLDLADITAPTDAIALRGTIALMRADITAPTTATVLQGVINADVNVLTAQGVASLDVKGVITSIALQTGIAAPSLDGLTGLITNLALAEGVAAPALDNYDVLINSVAFSEDIDYPNLPSYEATIGSISFAEGVAFTLPDSVVINSIAFAEGVDFPSIPQQELIIASVAFAEGVSAPALPAYEALIGSIKFAEGVSIGLSVSVAGIINALTLEGTIPAVAGITGAISSLSIAAGEDAPNPPSVDGIAGIIDSLTLDPSITLPTIRIPATAVVGPVTGGGEGLARTPSDEDPPNPMLPIQEIQGVINASLNKTFTEPIQLSGVINAVVRNVGSGAEGGEGGGDDSGAEDLEESLNNNYSAVEDLNTNIKQLNDSVKNVSTNLDPALGDTPRVDIPEILDKLVRQTGTASPTADRLFEGFRSIISGETQGSFSQFRPGGGGGGASGGAGGGALRVTFPTEAFVLLANIHTELAAQTKQFESINTHLADLRIGLFGAEPLKVQIVQGAVESGGIDPIVGVRAILANFENRGIPIRTEGGEDFFGGFNFADLAPAKLIEASQVTPLITSDQEAIKGLQTLNELMAQQVVSRGDEENPLYITATDPLPVEVKNKVQLADDEVIDVEVKNTEPIRVETGVVTIVISGTPVSVRIEDLGTLLNQLSQQNTASDSFGGQTI